MTRRRSPQWVRGAATLALSGLLAACSGGTSGIQPVSQTTTSFPHLSIGAAASTTTSTTDPTVAAILAAYRAGWADYLAVTTHFPIHPSDPRLTAYITGTELDTIHLNLTKAALASEYAVGTIDLAPVVTAVNGSTATVNDCNFDHTKIVNWKTGAVVSPGDTETTLINVTMTLDAGTWKMSNYQKIGAGCTPAT